MVKLNIHEQVMSERLCKTPQPEQLPSNDKKQELRMMEEN